jgi:integrase
MSHAETNAASVSAVPQSTHTHHDLLAVRDSGTISDTIDSTVQIGEPVSRRRFQKGSVYLNKARTVWLGSYAEYILDSHGVEKRVRKQIVLCAVKIGERLIGKREAQRLLQPYLDRVNSSLAAPAREQKSATFEAFVAIWERDYLSLSKPSTQSSTRSQLKRLVAAFGRKDIRRIDAGDIQRFISATVVEGLEPKTVRNLWGTISLIWDAALAQKYVDAALPKPKLPRRTRKKARFYSLGGVATVIAATQGEQRVFYWLAAETGLRAGELAGLRPTDLDGERLTVNQSVWHGKTQSPKTENAVRTLAVSPQLLALLWQQIARQKVKGHGYLFSSSNGGTWDMDAYRKRKLRPLLESLGVKPAGFHGFRHFNVSLLDALRVPLKTIQQRLGHALTGSFTLDVYGGKPEWEPNLEAARKIGAEIERAVTAQEQENERGRIDYFGSLTAMNQNGSGAVIS